MALPEYDLPFNAMGCGIRVLVGPSIDPSGTSAEAGAQAVRATIERFDQSLSRFNPGSELSQLNADPRETVPASPLLCSLVSAAVWAAEQSEGLLDPTLVGELEEVGYLETFRNATPAPLPEALLSAPTARPAAPRRDSHWGEIYVDHTAGTVTRPVGVRI
ncbi:MAG: hypothetical protein F2799_08080, partial [Actinobacteria bacterium]|nr:hypothetical protein [Actinomycetota bacterium]